MITQSGVHIQKKGGVEGTPTALDIAVHAGRICRFGGCVWYPLLPHLVFVGLMAYRRSGSALNMLWGFLHDAHEIATSDVPRPFKCQCMKIEQSSIDKRIFLKFARGLGGWNDIDHELIKQCDIDACHIEGVELGVPGFSEIELKHSKGYTGRKAIHGAIEDVELFHKIVNHAFNKNTIDGTDSLGVLLFADALSFAEEGDYDGVVESVMDWEILEQKANAAA